MSPETIGEGVEHALSRLGELILRGDHEARYEDFRVRGVDLRTNGMGTLGPLRRLIVSMDDGREFIFMADELRPARPVDAEGLSS